MKFLSIFVLLFSVQSIASGDDYDTILAKLNGELESMSFNYVEDGSLKIVLAADNTDHVVAVLQDSSIMEDHAVVIACNVRELELINCEALGFYPLAGTFFRFMIETLGGLDLPKLEIIYGIGGVLAVSIIYAVVGTYQKTPTVHSKVGTRVSYIALATSIGSLAVTGSIFSEQALHFLPPTLAELEKKIEQKYQIVDTYKTHSIGFGTFLYRLKQMLKEINLNYNVLQEVDSTL